MFISWGLSQIVFAIIFEFNNYWRDLILLYMAIPSIFQFLFFFIIKESPRHYFLSLTVINAIYRYTYFSGINFEEALQILKEIGKINKRPPLTEIEINKLKNYFPKADKKKEGLYNYFHLFSFKSLRKITITTSIANMVLNVSYYGIQFSFNDLGLSLFHNALFTGIVEIFAYILACT